MGGNADDRADVDRGQAIPARGKSDAERSVPHPTSIAVWDVPSPVVVNDAFSVNVGVKCAVGCLLTGLTFVVHDGDGVPVGTGRVGAKPWPGTSALAGDRVVLAAPGEERVFAWSVRFAGEQSAPPHAAATASFSFRTVQPPEHAVTVAVYDRATEAPLENVHVRFGSYRASTDARGHARLDVPTGRYALELSKVGYVARSRIVEVTGSAAVRVEAVSVPDADPDDDQVWM